MNETDLLGLVLITILAKLFLVKTRFSAQHQRQVRRLRFAQFLDIASNNEVLSIHARRIRICRGFCDYPKICIISILRIFGVKFYIEKTIFAASELRNMAAEVQFAFIKTAMYEVQLVGNFHSKRFEYSMSYRFTTSSCFKSSINADVLQTHCEK